jgi:predicted transcriptional regulator
MATMTIRATYALDPHTVSTLERLAKRWSVSKSAALRRAIRDAASRQGGANERLEALKRLQASVSLSVDGARRWENRVKTERRSAGDRRLRRLR